MGVDHNAVVHTVRAELDRLDDAALDTLRWENAIDDPPSDPDTLYIEESFIPFGESPSGSGYDRLLAEVRYTVVGPRGRGVEEIRALAGRIKSLFRVGYSMVGETTVVVAGSEILAGRAKDVSRYAVPVAIMVRADALRLQGV